MHYLTALIHLFHHRSQEVFPVNSYQPVIRLTFHTSEQWAQLSSG